VQWLVRWELRTAEPMNFIHVGFQANQLVDDDGQRRVEVLAALLHALRHGAQTTRSFAILFLRGVALGSSKLLASRLFCSVERR
jgi:hypothetical protein